MTAVCIGIHAYTEPERLALTLNSLGANTLQPVDILLLLDGPDATLRAALRRYSHLPQSSTAEPRGAAACFNRLITAARADVYVFLESGAIVEWGWLDFLLAALKADPRNGLAGPSTNHAWNEQRAFPRGQGTPAGVSCTAAIAAQRFGASWRPLAPLHSLADFCYAVRCDVVEAIGGADETYGLGPCWEMDYNIRAARAGFQGVWAGGAYVYRAPFTARRRHDEARLFETNKRLYQDRFCALRLRGQRTDYEPHCRGDACEHFAPAGLIQIALPLPANSRPPAAPAATPPKAILATNSKPASRNTKISNLQSPISDGTSTNPQSPMISCIMPTRDRPAFALQAVQYFLRQDYLARELIIVDDGEEGWPDQLPDDPRIRYLRLVPGQSIGAKRNKACEVARGDIIAHWDDDDWYSPDRLSAQAGPLLAGTADICGLTDSLFFELDRWAFWSCTRQLNRRLFVEDVHGGTLVYHRRVWQNLARYPNRSLAEDAIFLRQAIRHGARLHRLPGDNLYLYLRHGSNSWSFVCGRYLDPNGWLRVAEPAFLEPDRAFYALHSTALPTSRSPLPALPPLVSCIMPTADRRPFVPQAIQYFQRQDYLQRELIVVDDGVDPVADLIPDDPRIHYHRLEKKCTVGAKRNIACELARGDIFVHWDDDDWMASRRLTYQVTSLLRAGADVCGLDSVYYLEPQSGRAWQYVYRPGGHTWVAGNTLCYTRTLWQQNPFPDVNVGEDTRFMWNRRPKRIVLLPDPTFYVAVIHASNVSPKRLSGSRWHAYSLADIRTLIGADWPFYEQMM